MPSDCVKWDGSFDKDGYAQWPSSRWFGTRRAARILFYLETGTWPEVVMHTCDNPGCMNFDHLKPGTWASNNADRDAKGRGVPPPRNDFRGDRCPTRKLSSFDVRNIRLAIERGENQRKIALRFSVSPATITNIKKRKVWASV